MIDKLELFSIIRNKYQIEIIYDRDNTCSICHKKLYKKLGFWERTSPEYDEWEVYCQKCVEEICSRELEISEIIEREIEEQLGEQEDRLK